MSRIYIVTPFIYIIYRVHHAKCRAGWSTSWNQDCNNLSYANDTTLMAESEELKSLLMKVKEESEKAGLKLNTEKAMAPHSSTLSWKIPWMEEPGGLQSMGSLRVRHDWVTSLSLFTFMHWRRKRQPTPVFLPGESQGQGSLVGCRLWGRTELDTTEVT